MADLRVLLLSRYDRLGASSRLRFQDYSPLLEAGGIHVTHAPFFDDGYLRDLYAGRRAGAGRLVHYYRRRFRALRSARDHDVVWLEKEALPWLPASVELPLLAQRPWVIDFDDAWFERYDRHPNFFVRRALKGKFGRLVANATMTVVGNEYLGRWAKANGASEIRRIPTTVDLSRYRPAPPAAVARPFTIGWMGSPTSARYLHDLAPALAQLEKSDAARTVLVGSGPVDLPGVSPVILPWREESEAEDLTRFDVGIMPLTADRWSEGKCAYKLIQYMAAGLPVVASPVGMNREVVRDGETGFLADTAAGWITALRTLSADPALRSRMGLAGRRRVEEDYSLYGNAPRVADVLRMAASRWKDGTTR